MASVSAVKTGIAMLLSTFSQWRGVTAQEAFNYWLRVFERLSDDAFLRAVSVVCQSHTLPGNIIRAIYDAATGEDPLEAYNRARAVVAEFYHPDFHQTTSAIVMRKLPPVIWQAVFRCGIGEMWSGEVNYVQFRDVYEGVRRDRASAEQKTLAQSAMLDRLLAPHNLPGESVPDSERTLPEGFRRLGDE